MEEIMRVLRAMQEDITTQKKDMKEMEENIKISINNNIDDKFSRIEQRTDQLEKKIEQQQKTIDFLDRKLRKKNLLFFGVGETEKNYEQLLSMVLTIMSTQMEVVCLRWEIENVARVGKKNEKTRPIVVTLTTTSRKIELLKKKKSLENSGIYIKEDYPPAVLAKRRELQEELKRERESGKNVALRYDKIITLNTHKSPSKRYTEKQSNKRGLSVARNNYGKIRLPGTGRKTNTKEK